MTDRKRPKSSSWSFLYQTNDFGGALVFRHEDGSLALSSLGYIKEEKTDGFARKFFLAVEEKHRKKCECKDEEQVRLSENYVYSRKKKQ